MVRLASWRARAGAFALDVLPGAGVVAVLACWAGVSWEYSGWLLA